MSDSHVDLGISPRLLVPFVVAWRGAPAALDDIARATYVAKIMRDHDSTFTAVAAMQVVEHLKLVFGADLGRDEMGGRPAAAHTLGSTDLECVCCGSTSLRSSGKVNYGEHECMLSQKDSRL